MIKGRVLALAVFALLGACTAGTDFVRASDASLHLGQTTYADVKAMLGEPYSTEKIYKDGIGTQEIFYGYAYSAGVGQAADVSPDHGQHFYFVGGKLVGYDFTSSFKSDSTDFDSSKADLIQKGKSTQADVRTLLGAPDGQYMYPMVKGTDTLADVYLNSQVSSVGSNTDTFTKRLIVSYDANGTVTDVDYSESGEK